MFCKALIPVSINLLDYYLQAIDIVNLQVLDWGIKLLNVLIQESVEFRKVVDCPLHSPAMHF